jgi:oligosaccharide repeat unit polymerase
MNFNLKRIANPYAAFAILWAVCLILYSLGWAEIFPPITKDLFVFLLILIAFFALTGFFFGKIKVYNPLAALNLNYKILLIVNILFYSLNFLYSGIPLLQGTRNDDFGIPTVIVLATTLNCFTSLYCFMLFLVHKKKRFILYSLCCLSFFILIFSRGNIMFSLTGMFFLWLNVKRPVLTFKKAMAILGSILLLLYLFGVAGNFRSIGDLNAQNPKFDKTYNSNVILAIGGASDSFKNSIVPDEFFWSYLYITSPLSNLQYNINKNKPTFNATGVKYILIDELLFDSISKRIDDLMGRTRLQADLIIEQLTVCTALVGSYDYAGWGGMILFMSVLWIFPFLYLIVVKNNPLGIIGISTLCTVFFFSIFDNTFSLTGLTFQLLYPVIFNGLSKVRFNTKLITLNH